MDNNTINLAKQIRDIIVSQIDEAIKERNPQKLSEIQIALDSVNQYVDDACSYLRVRAEQEIKRIFEEQINQHDQNMMN